MHRGWFSTHRRLLHSELWLEEKFTRGQAWVDLIGLANHKDGYIRVRGIKVDVPRGAVGWSILSLGDRWKWSRGKVQRFLDELETVQQIVQQKNRLTSLIHLVNYDQYQRDDTTKRTTDGTTDGQQTDTNKNVKNVEKEKKKPNPPPPDALRLSGRLADYVINNTPTHAGLRPEKREATVTMWARDIDKLNRIDGYSWAQIEYLVDWCQHDTFWASNILSGRALRKQADTLVAKINREKTPKAPTGRLDKLAVELAAWIGEDDDQDRGGAVGAGVHGSVPQLPSGRGDGAGLE